MVVRPARPRDDQHNLIKLLLGTDATHARGARTVVSAASKVHTNVVVTEEALIPALRSRYGYVRYRSKTRSTFMLVTPSFVPAV